jgi:tetratricopeptide (TPR) repeat protein
MFPHQKLDWNLRRLEQHVEDAPEDLSARLELLQATLSRAWFHEGGEVWFNRALTQARRLAQSEPSNPVAQVVAGMALVHLDRAEPATRYLQEALRLAPERADVHVGLGLLHEAENERREAIHAYETACRLAPESWEPHYLLGRILGERALQSGAGQRLLERSQFHVVKALSLDPAPAVVPALLHQLGLTCLRSGRLTNAHQVFLRLLEYDKFKSKARYYVGLSLYHMGKYKNAVLFLRQHLDDHPDNPPVLARIAMAYLHLGEVEKAREACNRALAIDSGDLQARWTLGCALLEEGQAEEAVKIFREILHDAPDHVPAFTELVRLRTVASDARWLASALRAEVSIHDRLPLADQREIPGSTQHMSRERRRSPVIGTTPRATTRERIGIVLRALAELDADEVPVILECMNLTTDEGLRFQLWEAGLDAMAARRAKTAIERLKSPGTTYAASAGRDVLALSAVLPEPLLVRGLQIDEEDLKRAAIERHGPARDVQAHRINIERERQEARAWQALLLLSVATRQSRSGRNLLVRWAADADAELADAARAALAMLGDAPAAERLREKARARGSEHLLDGLLAEISPPEVRFHPRPVADGEDVHCTTCGRRAPDVDHLMAGGDAVICDTCMTTIARDRRELATDDPAVTCCLCGRSGLESRAVYVHRGTSVCADCVDHSLGLLEREEVDRYLAAW